MVTNGVVDGCDHIVASSGGRLGGTHGDGNGHPIHIQILRSSIARNNRGDILMAIQIDHYNNLINKPDLSFTNGRRLRIKYTFSGR